MVVEVHKQLTESYMISEWVVSPITKSASLIHII